MNLEFDPSNVLEPAPDEMARTLWKQGALVEAEELYATMLQRRPHDARAWLDAGRLSDELGRSVEAVERLRQAVGLASDKPLLHDEARAALAKAYMHRGAFSEAGWLWWRIAREGTDRALGWAGLATCAHFAGQSRLVKRCERKLEAKTSRQERRRLLADMWVHGAGGDLEIQPPKAADGRPSPLVRLLRSSARSIRHHAATHPDRADAQYHLAICAEALGEKHAAEAAIARALSINPRYAAARVFGSRLAA